MAVSLSFIALPLAPSVPVLACRRQIELQQYQMTNVMPQRYEHGTITHVYTCCICKTKIQSNLTIVYGKWFYVARCAKDAIFVCASLPFLFWNTARSSDCRCRHDRSSQVYSAVRIGEIFE
jgi:hypothetical protein